MLLHAELAEIAGRCYRKPWSGQAALDCEYDLLPRGDEELVVAIPGTHPDDPLDWIRDLSTPPRRSRSSGLPFGLRLGRDGGRRARARGGQGRSSPDDGRRPFARRRDGADRRRAAHPRRLSRAHRHLRRAAGRVPRQSRAAASRRTALATRRISPRRRSVPHVPTRPIFRHVTHGIAIGVDAAIRSAIIRSTVTPPTSPRRRRRRRESVRRRPPAHSPQRKST